MHVCDGNARPTWVTTRRVVVVVMMAVVVAVVAVVVLVVTMMMMTMVMMIRVRFGVGSSRMILSFFSVRQSQRNRATEHLWYLVLQHSCTFYEYTAYHRALHNREYLVLIIRFHRHSWVCSGTACGFVEVLRAI